MKIWVTEIQAIHPTNPDRGIIKWCGPEVPGLTATMAQEYCNTHGLGYCKVIGELVSEIGCIDGTYEPDFNNIVDYEDHQNN